MSADLMATSATSGGSVSGNRAVARIRVTSAPVASAAAYQASTIAGFFSESV